MECIHLLIQVAVLKVQKTKGVEVKVSTAFHFHLTHPVKLRAWSLLTTITLQVLFGDPAVLQNVPELHLWHISAFQRAACPIAPWLGHRGSPSGLTRREGARGCWSSLAHKPGLNAALTFWHLAFVLEPTIGRRIPLPSSTPLLSWRAVVLNHTHTFPGFQLKNHLCFHSYCAYWKAVWSIIPFPSQNCSISAVQRTLPLETPPILRGWKCNSQPVSLCREMFGKVFPQSPSGFLTPCAALAV